MSRIARNAIAVLVVTMMVLGPLLAIDDGAEARITREFSDGKKEVDLEFPSGTESYVVNITIPRTAQLTSAQLGVSGMPLGSVLQYPKGPALDLGKDGIIDWQFWGPGYGALGRQQVLSDNATSGKVVFSGPGSDQGLVLRLPADANIGSAVMRVTGGPNAAGWWNQSWLYRIPINISNNRAIDLGEVLVDVWIDTSGLGAKDAKEFRVVFLPSGGGTPEERPSQVVDEKTVSGLITEARVVFRTKSLGAMGRQEYQLYLSNPSPPTPPMAKDFKPNDIRDTTEAPPSESPSATAPNYS